MFVIERSRSGAWPIEYRRERLTGLSCTISPTRLSRGLNHVPAPAPAPVPGECPFCPGQVDRVTPTFPDGSRIRRGESITFPNLYPFAPCHTVTVITRAHACEQFRPRQLSDALEGAVASIAGAPGYASVNWNYLHSAGASLDHPHLQGVVMGRPSFVHARHLAGSARFLSRAGRPYREALVEHEQSTDRFLFGDEVVFIASAVPIGEREVRALLPAGSLEEAVPYLECLATGLCRVFDLYQDLGSHAFNIACFFGRPGRDRGFSAFCSVISRINPNTDSISDSAFMERLHLQPIVMTLPEEIGRYSRGML